VVSLNQQLAQDPTALHGFSVCKLNVKCDVRPCVFFQFEEIAIWQQIQPRTCRIVPEEEGGNQESSQVLHSPHDKLSGTDE
jgi:hypothetical protein